MITRSKATGLMMVAAFVFSPLAVYAQSGPEGFAHHGMGFHLPSIEKVLSLSADQSRQLQAIHQQQRSDMKAAFEQIKTNRETLDNLIVAQTPDMAKINDIQAQFKTIQSQMDDGRLNALLAIKKILSPEQFTGFIALTKEREMIGHHAQKGGWDGRKQGGDKDKKADKTPAAQIAEDQE